MMRQICMFLTVFALTTARAEKVTECPEGGDATAVGWETLNERWVRNHYADGSITMSDRETGLMWVHDAGAHGRMNWQKAMEHCANLDYAGYGDWFLPDHRQLEALYPHLERFTGIPPQFKWYWSSTSPERSEGLARDVNMDTGRAGYYDKVAGDFFWVWPCRVAR